MASLPSLTGNAGLLSMFKGSERTASIPGAENGGTNLSSAFAAVQPRTAAEQQMYADAAALAVGNGHPITAEYYLDQARAGRDAEKEKAGWTPNFNLGDMSKKISEGTDALGKKFTSFEIGKKFDGIATGAKEFLFGKSPEAIKKMTPAEAALAKANLDKAAAGTASASALNATLGQTNADDTSHLVTLTDAEGYILTFYVMPEIVEQRQVQYEPVAPPQFPGAFQKYKGTDSVQWTVNATLVCRTTEEATRNLEYLNRLRGWTMPFFGENTKNDARFKNKTGAPPPVLKFKGFRESIVGEVPVVITSLNWNWPKDVDWIPAQKLTDNRNSGGMDGSLTGGEATMKGDATIPFPTIIQVAIQLVESFSTEQFNNFNLAEYRVGHMLAAFVGTPSVQQNQTAGQPDDRGEAQAPPQGALRGLRSDALPADPNRIYPIQTTLSSAAGAGRGFVNPPSVTEAIQSTTANIQKRAANVIPPIKSGGGGDFGGGGASGSY